VQIALKLTLVLTLVFGLCIGVIRARPADNPLRALLTSPENCAAPCYLGIHPGVTTADDAMAILASYPWVQDIRRQTTYIDRVYWRWNDPPDAVIDASTEGSLWLVDEIVQEIAISTTLTFGDVWLLLGPAQRGSFLLGSLDVPGKSGAFHTALYRDARVEVAFVAECPIRLQAFWESRVTVRWISNPDTYMNQQFYLPDWNNSSCQ
jgi:hypothetical protein